MPHPAILKELNMTPADWGRISSEEERSKLKNKAAEAILEREKAESKGGIHARLAGLESRVEALESRPAVTPPNPNTGG